MHDTHQHIVNRDYPELVIDSFRPLGEGWNNTAFVVNDDLIFRFAKDSDANAVQREIKLLGMLQSFSPLPVPNPTYQGTAPPYMGYPAVKETPLVDMRESVTPAEWPDFAATIGTFLSVINAIPLDQVRGLVDEDFEPLDVWLEEANDTYAKVEHVIPTAVHGAIRTFMNSRPPPASVTPCFCHNDLGIEHILADMERRKITGIIDWGDAAIADPAYDLGMIYRDLGKNMLDAVLSEYQTDAAKPDLRERAVFYARCTVFEDIKYGLETGGNEYVDKSRISFTWLFSE